MSNYSKSSKSLKAKMNAHNISGIGGVEQIIGI